jgi:hypothetical protein
MSYAGSTAAFPTDSEQSSLVKIAANSGADVSGDESTYTLWRKIVLALGGTVTGNENEQTLIAKAGRKWGADVDASMFPQVILNKSAKALGGNVSGLESMQRILFEIGSAAGSPTLTRPNPADYGTPTLALWGDDAPSGIVSIWPHDTYGPDAAQVTGAVQPIRANGDINGHSAVNFNGGKWMTFGTVAIRTLFIVFKHNSGTQDYGHLIGEATSVPMHGGAGTNLFISFFTGEAPFKLGTVFKNGGVETFDGIQKPVAYSVLSMVGDTSPCNFNRIATTTGQEGGFGGARIGDFRYAAILGFSNALIDVKRKALESALGAYFNIPITP